jgi:hypothetical protein
VDIGDLGPELLTAARLAGVLHGVLAHGRLDDRSRERLDDAIGCLLAVDELELRRIVRESHERLLRELLLSVSRHLIASVEPADELASTAAAVGVVLVDGDMDPNSRRLLQRLHRQLTQP